MKLFSNQFYTMTCILAVSWTTTGCNPVQQTRETQSNTEATKLAVEQKASGKQEQGSRKTSQDWTIETPVGAIVADRPETARVLELVGIDYCCGGQSSLKDAANLRGVDPSQLLRALLVVGSGPETVVQKNWNQAPLDELIEHIVSKHHGWLRRELPGLLETTETVLQVHGKSHSELAEVTKVLKRINDSVLPHLDEEEKSLFPAIRKLEAGTAPDDIAFQLQSMRSDHDELGAELHRLRELTHGFKGPDDACATYRQMLTGLTTLERDMLQHVHLENNILLPRALSLLAKRVSKK